MTDALTLLRMRWYLDALTPRRLGECAPVQFHAEIKFFFFFNYFQHAISTKIKNTGQLPNITWDRIGGMSDVKENLQQFIRYSTNFSQEFLEYGISPPKGVLLHGPRGCGKTLIAEVFADHCKCNFVSVNGHHLLPTLDTKTDVEDIFVRVSENRYSQLSCCFSPTKRCSHCFTLKNLRLFSVLNLFSLWKVVTSTKVVDMLASKPEISSFVSTRIDEVAKCVYTFNNKNIYTLLFPL